MKDFREIIHIELGEMPKSIAQKYVKDLMKDIRPISTDEGIGGE